MDLNVCMKYLSVIRDGSPPGVTALRFKGETHRNAIPNVLHYIFLTSLAAEAYPFL